MKYTVKCRKCPKAIDVSKKEYENGTIVYCCYECYCRG